MVETKPRVRVAARTREVLPPVSAVTAPAIRPQARYLRDSSTGILSMRRAVTRDGFVDVREAAGRAAGLAIDFMHNSGWIAGAAKQIIVDTIGTELKLNHRPNLASLRWSAKEMSDWAALVQAEWRLWAWNPAECDLAGKATVAEMLDGVVRYYLGYGEGIGILSFLGDADRRRYGIETGTKVSLIAPHRLPNRTSEFEGLYGGIFHDANERATHYRFRRRDGGIERDDDIAAFDAAGLAQVIHVMDRGETPDSPRGITPIAPALKVIAQYDQAADATLSQLLLQQAFAAVITSPEPSEQAFQAIQTLSDTEAMPRGYPGGAEAWQEFVGGLAADLFDVWGQRVDALKKGGVNLAEHARVAHTGPGEDLKFVTANTPGSNYLPFTQHLHREIARCMGVTATSLTMDFNGATYSSVRMETATIWPLAVRRRERVAAPFAQAIFEAWLDEKVANGSIPFKGGYRAFVANRQKACWAEWRGPSKPTADDSKSATAQKLRLENGVTSLQDECAEDGRDWEEVARQRAAELARLTELGLPNPFQRMSGGAGGPNGTAAEGNREPARP